MHSHLLLLLVVFGNLAGGAMMGLGSKQESAILITGFNIGGFVIALMPTVYLSDEADRFQKIVGTLFGRYQRFGDDRTQGQRLVRF